MIKNRRQRKWQDQSGQDRYTTEVVINPIGGTLQILGSRNGGENMGDSSQNWGQSANNSSSAPGDTSRPLTQNTPAQLAATPEPPMDFDDDIPF